ncbi:MAG: hypothetical protein ACXWZP_09065 [Gaiellaceae bacterium]
MSAVAAADVFEVMADEAARESPLWRASLRPREEREPFHVFSSLGDPVFALGVETIYEGYLVHYGCSRLFAPVDGDTALLLGDYLYAHGLVRIAATGSVDAVYDLAELIALCAQARAGGGPGEAAAWAATAALLGRGGLVEARGALRDRGDASLLDRIARATAGDGAVEHAIAAHDARVG